MYNNLEGVVGPVGGGGGREGSQAMCRPQSNQEEVDGSLGGGLSGLDTRR